MFRGATTSITKNRRLLGDVATGGALSVGGTVNNLVKNSPFGATKIGKVLTTDISAPIYKAAKVRQRLRNVTNGVFSNDYNNSFLIDF